MNLSVLKQEILIDREVFRIVSKLMFKFLYYFCLFPPKAPKRRRPARSIFDGFRDFQTETSRYLWTSLSSLSLNSFLSPTSLSFSFLNSPLSLHI